AVEVAASVDGQIMPPVMGAAAFLMVEYVGIPYTEVLKHALLPAIISYIALFYIVHLEALKAGIEGIPRRRMSSGMQRLVSFGFTVCGLVLLAAATYWGLGWIKSVTGDASTWVIGVLMAVVYLGLLWISAHTPELRPDDLSEKMQYLPETRPT